MGLVIESARCIGGTSKGLNLPTRRMNEVKVTFHISMSSNCSARSKKPSISQTKSYRDLQTRNKKK